METLERDIFIVHSKSNPRESALADALVSELHAVDIRVWLYDDWDWEHRMRRRGRGQRMATGRLEELDHVRLAMGDPTPFNAPVEEVDEGTLGEMLHGSRVVLLCEPADGAPSAGVTAERRVIASLARGPMLLHALWPDSDGDFFERLGPTARVHLPHDTATDAVVEEAFAAVACGWLVHTLQHRFGPAGGHRLLRAVGERHAALRPLIENSPRFVEPETPGPPAGSGEADVIADMFARMRSLEVSWFPEWWDGPAAKVRSRSPLVHDGGAHEALEALTAAVDDLWRDAFA